MKINNPGNGNGNCYMGMGGNERESKIHSRTPLIGSVQRLEAGIGLRLGLG